jgi:hypothetical protein
LQGRVTHALPTRAEGRHHPAFLSAPFRRPSNWQLYPLRSFVELGVTLGVMYGSRVLAHGSLMALWRLSDGSLTAL